MKLKMVQLDLARQSENLEYIFEFIDFAGASGFNAILLYLEGKVSTPGFQYPESSEAYSLSEMSRIVQYAARAGLEIIPAVSVLGHCEHFLRTPELAGLAELRGGKTGRTGSDFRHVICPSMPGTMDFFQHYLSELSAVFPAGYLHLGCDEEWDVGTCELCSKRVENGETPDMIFAGYLNRMNDFVREKLHKRMVIWDDLLETYTYSLKNLSRDIILCCWQYEKNIDLPRAHFKNCRKYDWLAIYRDLGYEFWFAPSVYSLNNIESFTRYALPHEPLGGLLTTWEKNQNTCFECYPLIRYCGKLWNGNHSFEQAVGEFFGCGEKNFLDAMRAFVEMRINHHTRTDIKSYFQFPIGEADSYYRFLSRCVGDLLSEYRRRWPAGEVRGMVIEDIFTTLEWRELMFDLWELASAVIRMDRSEGTWSGIRRMAERAKELSDKKLEVHRKFRLGRSEERLQSAFEKFREDILSLTGIAEKQTGYLEVDFFLPDACNAQNVEIGLRFADGNCEKVASGCFKPYRLEDCRFGYRFPIFNAGEVTGARIESRMYGGIGISYLKVFNGRRRFVPLQIRSCGGQVEHAGHLLVEDTRYAYIGERDMDALLNDPELLNICHSIDLKMGEPPDLI